jgi:hypothetical protein
VSGVSEIIQATGTSCPPEAFQFLTPAALNPEDITRVLRGDAVGCLFRGAIDPDVCRRVARNFRDHPRLRRRSDDVPAYFLGTYHYRKPLALYLDEAAAFRDTMHDVFDGCDNVFRRVMSSVTSALAAEAITFRVAGHEGAAASEFVMRSWSGSGQFSLEPHDDAAQLTHPLQRGFEIQRVAAPLVAFNMCLENPGAGELHFWNIVPDEATRVRLGLQETGYPYPLDVLKGIDRLVVPIHAGDIYFFNGKHVHAVGAQAEATGYRSTISGLMGFLDPRTVIYWS